ncbi:MAG: restriction endonuclease [archaeon GB-1867-005]|nr:restriction endonuclease [Candidatus Culexmicrobium cathedralense]
MGNSVVALNLKARIACEILKLSLGRSIVVDREIAEGVILPLSRVRELMRELADENLINLEFDGKALQCYPTDRLKLAFYAIKLGADVQSVALTLNWREFEDICARAFQIHGYDVYRNFRFAVWRHRYEIDVIGIREPLIICVDCKRWSAGRFSAVRKSALRHFERLEALSICRSALTRLGIYGWPRAIFIAAILSIYEDKIKIYEGIPIVPVFKFNSFLNELPIGLSELRKIEIKMPSK